MDKTVIKLGMEVQDIISGWTGICTCVTDWLYGCRRIGIQPQGLDKDGRKQETEFFDVSGVIIIGPGLNKPEEPKPKKEASPGGPDRERPGREKY
jgi:hypothetical protein